MSSTSLVSLNQDRIKQLMTNTSTNTTINVLFEFARRGQYLAAVSRCAASEEGGVSIWQVRPLRVCERLAKQRPANGHPSKNRHHINFEWLLR